MLRVLCGGKIPLWIGKMVFRFLMRFSLPYCGFEEVSWNERDRWIEEEFGTSRIWHQEPLVRSEIAVQSTTIILDI